MKTNQLTACPRYRGESAQAYEALTTYIVLGPQRSIANAAKRLGKSKSLLERWSSRYEWVKRADAYGWAECRKLQEAFELRISRAVQAGRQITRQDITGE
jgi:transposase